MTHTRWKSRTLAACRMAATPAPVRLGPTHRGLRMSASGLPFRTARTQACSTKRGVTSPQTATG
eukprot:7087652-Alexandrium_andersonii.AAC.1